MPHLALCAMHAPLLGASLNPSFPSPHQHAVPIPSAFEVCMLKAGSVSGRADL